MLFGGKNGPQMGIRINPKTVTLETFEITDAQPVEDALVHDETNEGLAMLIAKMSPPMPVAMGVIFRVQRPTYEQQVHAQIQEAQSRDDAADLNRILQEGNTWTVE